MTSVFVNLQLIFFLLFLCPSLSFSVISGSLQHLEQHISEEATRPATDWRDCLGFFCSNQELFFSLSLTISHPICWNTYAKAVSRAKNCILSTLLWASVFLKIIAIFFEKGKHCLFSFAAAKICTYKKGFKPKPLSFNFFAGKTMNFSP